MSENGYYIEYVSLAGQVKVTALDPRTGIEVSIVAPSKASQAEMNRIVVQKLQKRIRREQADETTDTPEAADKRRGIIV